MAAAGVIGAVGGDRFDLFANRNLRQRVRKDGAVALPAGGELDRADIAGGRVHRRMHLAPLTPADRAVLTRKPFAVTAEADASAADQQVQGLAGAPIRDLTAIRAWRRHRVE